MAGAIFETVVLLEIVKSLLGRGTMPQIYFFRTPSGIEVDLVLDVNGMLTPIEIKLSASPRIAMANGISKFRELFAGKVSRRSYVVHAGNVVLSLAPQIVAIPFAKL
jgi:predicted AAA+ superfamily ATPase